MTDLIRADPAVIEAYAAVAATAAEQVDVPLATYASAWQALGNAPSSTPLDPPAARDGEVRALLDELTALDEEARALGEALRWLDADANGVLTTDESSAELLALYLKERAKDPTASISAVQARTELVAQTGQELVTVLEANPGEPRVVRLNLEALGPLEGVSQEDLQEILAAYGITGANGGPVHFVVHGWTGNADSSALATGDLYQQQGVNDATVVAVNWSAGNGGATPSTGMWFQNPALAAGIAAGTKAGDFEYAESSAMATGDQLTKVFTALAAENPDANVAVTAHSLGNHVALRALSQMTDPVDPATGHTTRFQVDYTGIQPAVPSLGPFLDPAHYGALVTDRIDELTLTVNTSDKALLAYEARPWGDGSPLGGEALGDEAADSDVIRTIIDQRNATGAGTTAIVDQNSSQGSGHLGLDPNASDGGLVRSLYQEQIDRTSGQALGGVSPQTAIREYVHGALPDGMDDRMFASGPVQAYLDRCQAAGVAPTAAELDPIMQAEFERDPLYYLDL